MIVARNEADGLQSDRGVEAGDTDTGAFEERRPEHRHVCDGIGTVS